MRGRWTRFAVARLPWRPGLSRTSCFLARLFFAAWLIALFPGGAKAAELISGPAVEFTEETRAVIRWKTDVSTGSRVFYGETVERMTRRGDGGQGIEHEVTLRPLSAGTKWYYSVGTARLPLATNSFVVPGEVSNERTRSVNAKDRAAPSKVEQAPPTVKTWGHLASLEDHFRRHGGDFKAKSADDYARLAWEFRERAKREGLLTKVDSDGVVRIYDPKTGAFGAYNRDGTTKTFFKPNSPGYFDRQPGELVKGKRE